MTRPNELLFNNSLLKSILTSLNAVTFKWIGMLLNYCCRIILGKLQRLSVAVVVHFLNLQFYVNAWRSKQLLTGIPDRHPWPASQTSIPDRHPRPASPNGIPERHPRPAAPTFSHRRPVSGPPQYLLQDPVCFPTKIKSRLRLSFSVWHE